ncbi:MAG: ADP-ribosylglycohydrolase family protein [Clostridia bacterium]|nr:ADP-ribosylglycohydrolase family protein [Clostridia bacterium]
MKGAICGDVIGSRFERKNTSNKNFKLLAERNFRSRGSHYTDDTYLTVAIADAFLHLSDEEIKDDNKVVETIKNYLIQYGFGDIKNYFGRKYREWIESANHEPYGAFSNGALMRCSSAAYVATTVEDAYRLGGLTAMPTHNSEEAIKAASVLCESIFLMNHGFIKTKDDYKTFITKYYPILTASEIIDENENYKSTHDGDFDITCNHAIKAGIVAFLNANSFEDAIRTAISYGGDSDTIADIAGSLAEAYYGVPNDIWEQVSSRLTKDMLDVIDSFYNRFVTE